jgi:hypothetical protein
MANNFKNVKVDLSSTSITTLYTAPAAHNSVFKSIIVSNDSGSDDTITLTITDSASAVFSVYKVKAVSANTTVELLSQPLVVMENEILKVTAGASDRLHIIGSFLEIT